MSSSGDVNRLPFAASAPEVSAQTEGGQLPMGVPLLFIDASAPQVQTGLWLGGRWLAHRSVQAAALEEIFRSVQSLLTEAKLPFSALGGFIHNEGPGSILGIRLGAMALRVWAQGGQAARTVDGEALQQPQGAQACKEETFQRSQTAQTGNDEASQTAQTTSEAPLQGHEVAGGNRVFAVAESALPIWAVRSLPLVAAKVALGQAGCAVETVGAGAASAGGQAAVGSEQAKTLAETFSQFFNTGAGGVFSEFRQGLWNWFTPSPEDVFGEGIEVIATEELARRLAACRNRVWHLRHRKSWEAPPEQALEADSNLCDCPQVFLLPGLLRRITVPEALLTRAPEFKTASGERHRASGQAGGASLAAGRQFEGKRPSG